MMMFRVVPALPILLVLALAAGTGTNSAAAATLDEFAPCDTTGTFRCKAHSAFNIVDDIVTGAEWDAKVLINQTSTYGHTFLFQLDEELSSPEIVAAAEAIGLPNFTSEGNCVYRLWSDPASPAVDCNDLEYGSHSHYQFVDGCDRYYGNTVDAVHNEGEFAHATSFECVREGVEGLELELFDAFESTPTCDDIEGFYECQIERVVPFNGVFSYRSDTFTHEIRKVGDRAFLVGNESDDPAMCSFVISTEDDDVEYDDDFDARARCADYTDASEQEIRFYDSCQSYLFSVREALSEAPGNDTDPFGIPQAAFGQCIRVDAISNLENAFSNADFDELEAPKIDVEVCDIGGTWECNTNIFAGGAASPVQRSNSDVDLTIDGVEGMFDSFVSSFSGSLGDPSRGQNLVCKVEAWSDPTAPTAVCVDADDNGHAFFHFADGCQTLLVSKLESRVDPGDDYFNLPNAAMGECNKSSS